MVLDSETWVLGRYALLHELLMSLGCSRPFLNLSLTSSSTPVTLTYYMWRPTQWR